MSEKRNRKKRVSTQGKSRTISLTTDAPVQHILTRKKRKKTVEEKLAYKRQWDADNRNTGRPRGRPPKSDENEVSITATEVLAWTRSCKSTFVIHRGGAGSSKSHSIAQVLIERFFSCPGRRILILRKYGPSIRQSTLYLVRKLLSEYRMIDLVKEEITNMNFQFNGSIIQFMGLDDVEKVKSSEFNDIWMEEATEFTYEDFMVLTTRLRAPVCGGLRNQMYLSFNPTDEYCWIKRKVIDHPETYNFTEYVSNYKNNPYIEPTFVKTILDYERQDKNYYRIYTLGEWGKLDNVIFSNWEVVKEIPEIEFEICYGVDFGFNAPSTLLKLYIDGQNVWVEELLYESNLTNFQFIQKIRGLIPEDRWRKDKIYCDSAEPDRIAELNNNGLWAVPAYKSQGSVKDSIDHIKSYRLFISASSDKTLKEIRSYSWKVDKDGNKMEEPVKRDDHAMSALRYALFTRYMESLEGKPMVRTVMNPFVRKMGNKFSRIGVGR